MVCIKNVAFLRNESYLDYSENFYANSQCLNMLWKVEITKSDRV